MRADAKERKGANFANDELSQRLRIVEIYASRQGEGVWTGAPSVFLRTSGCNLRCWFCDTPFASWHPEGEMLSIEQAAQRALAYSEPDVVITGGEPLLFKGIGELCKRLRAAGRRLTIETAGTVDQAFECDLLSISPKLASSAPDRDQHPHWHRLHHARRRQVDLVRRWLSQYNHQLKFVVSTLQDTEEVEQFLDELQDARPENVWLMPEGTSVRELEARAEWLEPWCAQRGFRYCPRQHIYWYGNKRGT
jgi:7-carboxy-7-deazaguanine synthase